MVLYIIKVSPKGLKHIVEKKKIVLGNEQSDKEKDRKAFNGLCLCSVIKSVNFC